MPTPYRNIIQRAQFRVTDYDVLKRSFQCQIDMMAEYLFCAVADFAPHCEFDLEDRDEDLFQFNQDLDHECIQILALGIAAYWMSSKTLNSELLRNKLSTKEYSYFSPANLLGEVQTLRDTVMREFKSAIIRYTYRHGNIVSPGQEVT